MVICRRILGIETSCDETGIAIYDQYQGIIANQVYSQSMLHADYGGVVPELAAREHVLKIIPIILSVLKKSSLKYSDITGIAYTAGPGLVSSLLIGATVACSLAYAWGIPSIAIHHMEAHLLAPMLESVIPKFPYIGLLVSGGHTQLILAQDMGNYKILGESIDDAVGEVFDKIAVLLGIKYPGGSLLSKMAQYGVPGRYKFPRPMINKPGLNFSFSGLKTFVANTIMSSIHDAQTFADIAYEFENAVVDTLVIKCFRALKQTGLKTLVISGGVSANRVLRFRLLKSIYKLNGKLFFPRLEFCTDNGAMVAYVGYIRSPLEVSINNNLSIFVDPRWSLESLDKVNFYL